MNNKRVVLRSAVAFVHGAPIWKGGARMLGLRAKTSMIIDEIPFYFI
jgi:hypothetical protein